MNNETIQVTWSYEIWRKVFIIKGKQLLKVWTTPATFYNNNRNTKPTNCANYNKSRSSSHKDGNGCLFKKLTDPTQVFWVWGPMFGPIDVRSELTTKSYNQEILNFSLGQFRTRLMILNPYNKKGLKDAHTNTTFRNQ